MSWYFFSLAVGLLTLSPFFLLEIKLLGNDPPIISILGTCLASSIISGDNDSFLQFVGSMFAGLAVGPLVIGNEIISSAGFDFR